MTTSRNGLAKMDQEKEKLWNLSANIRPPENAAYQRKRHQNEFTKCVAEIWRRATSASSIFLAWRIINDCRSTIFKDGTSM
jgi:hypothetical protein